MMMMMMMMIVGLGSAILAQVEEGFTPLFNGKDFAGWKFNFPANKDHDPAKTFKVENGEMVCMGKPYGYMYTEKKYKDFTLRLEWKYARPANLTDDKKFDGNSGYLLFVNDMTPVVGKVWPKTIEVQGRWSDVAKIFNLGIKSKNKSDDAAREKARKPVGEWNTCEIVSKNSGPGGESDPLVVAFVNGVKITEVYDHDLKGQEGHILFQSEGAEIHWKNVRIKAGAP